MWFKGIIVEIKDDYSLVMKDDSSIVRINNKEEMKIGDIAIFLEEDIYIEEIEEQSKNKNSRNSFVISILSAVAALALIILPMIQQNLAKPYATISLDVNPSIEFELDKNKNIIDINTINKDANNLELSDIKGLSLEEGIMKIDEVLENNNYQLKNDSAIVGFAFITDEQDDTYEQEVKDIISKTLKQTKTAYLKGNKDDVKKAKNRGISLGRYKAEFNIDDEFLEEKIENMSVEQILNLLNGKSNIFLNEEIKEELHDELEDKIEENNSETSEENDLDDYVEPSYENNKDNNYDQSTDKDSKDDNYHYTEPNIKEEDDDRGNDNNYNESNNYNDEEDDDESSSDDDEDDD